MTIRPGTMGVLVSLLTCAASCSSGTTEPAPLVLDQLLGNGQEGDILKHLTSPITIRLSQSGKPAAGVSVRFLSPESGILFSPGPEAISTDAAGVASARVYLGPNGGRQQAVILANEDSVGTLSFTATLPLTVRNDGDGRGRVIVKKGDVTVVDCVVELVRTCVASLYLNDVLVATGTADPGFRFMNWATPEPCRDQEVCRFTITRAMSLWPRFIRTTP